MTDISLLQPATLPLSGTEYFWGMQNGQPVRITIQSIPGGPGSNISASVVTATEAITARTLADRFAQSYAPEDFNAIGDGIANDAAAVVSAAQQASASGVALYLAKSYFIGNNITLPSPLSVIGPGALLGVACSAGAFPTVTISIAGTLGSPISLGASAITPGTSSFTVANMVAIGDLLLLSNTSGASTSRKELLEAAYGTTGSVIAATTGTVCNYAASTGAQIQVVSPATVTFIGVTFKNLSLASSFCKGVTYSACKAFQCSLLTISDFGDWIEFAQWDGGVSAGLINPTDSSRDFTIRGNFTGGVGVSDNGVIKTMGCQKYRVDAMVTGTIADGGDLHAFMADMYYAGNPSGYDYLPNMQADVRLVVSDIDGNAIFITNTGSSASDAVTRDFTLSGIFGAAGQTWGGIQIKNASHIVIDGDFGGTTGSGFELGSAGGDVQSDITFVGYNGPQGYTLNGTNTNVRGIRLPWTPEIAYGGSSSGFTQSGSGFYVIDPSNHVHAIGSVSVTSTGMSSGAVTITTPSAVSGSSGAFVTGRVAYYTGLASIAGAISFYAGSSSTVADAYQGGATAVAALTNTNVPNGALIEFTMDYPQ